jgi:phage gp36-like protein
VALPYWSEEDLVARVGIDAILAAYDRDNDGEPDDDAIARLQADCDAHVEGYLRGIYDLDVVREVKPEQVKRLSLDYAEARVWRMSPPHARGDWAEYVRVIDGELTGIRNGKARLDIVGAPEPAANVGGKVFGAYGSVDCPPTRFFIDGMGDF